MTDKIVEGKKYHNGNVLIGFDAWYLSDSQGRWRLKPWVFFMKGIINKYFYTFPLEAGYKGKLVGDTALIYNKLKTLFKSYQPDSKEMMSEKDVMKEVAKDVKGSKKGDEEKKDDKKDQNDDVKIDSLNKEK